MEKYLQEFERLVKIMDDLREKCPWDKKQTLESLRHLSIEEVYELSDAIVEGDDKELSKEIGDLFLHLVFYARIGKERGTFTLEEVLHGICEKLIYRHPHIYGDVEVTSEEEVKANWEKLKLKEKNNKGVLSGVPKGLPSLVKATRIQDKAKGIGFDWENSEDVLAKIQEEIDELKKAKTVEEKSEELGDVLFSVINYARFIDVDPDEALEKTNKKFIHRFNWMEENAKEYFAKPLSELDLEQMETLWQKAKVEG